MTETQRLTSSESHELADIVRVLGAREVLHLLKNYQQDQEPCGEIELKQLQYI